MKYIVTLLIAVFIISNVTAQDGPPEPKRDTLRVRHPKIIAYKFNRDFTSLDSIPIDTVMRRFQVYYKPLSERAQNVFLGNLNLPYTSVIFSNRAPMKDFVFSQYIEYNFHQPEDITYYKTWSPFTELTYFTGGPKSSQEQMLNILHTQNVNKNLNVGFLGDLNYADGQYLNQKARSNAFTLWAGYKGLRYSAYGNVSLNSYKAQENGGITADSLYLKGTTDARNISVNLQSANVAIKRQTIFFNQRLYLTGSFKADSLGSHSKWNEALSIIHQFRYERYSRGFTDVLTSDSSFYKNADIFPLKKNSNRDSVNFNSSATADSSYFRRIENTFMLAFNANDLLKVPAELRVGLKSQIDKYKYGSKLDSTKVLPDTFYRANPLIGKNADINTALVGSLSDRFSKTIQWGVSGEYFFSGSKAGNLDLNGDIEKSIRRNVILKLSGRLAITNPSYFIGHFKSNHFTWNNTKIPSQKTSTVHAGLYFPKFKLFLDAQLDNYSDYLYFGADANPTTAKILSVQSLTANKLIDWGFFHTEFRLTFQSSSDKSAVAIPNFSGFNSTYLEFTLFKVLHLQYGVDVMYNSAFAPDTYMPETGVFYSQDPKNAIKVGNYPYSDMFLNIKLKRFRFFLKYERINTWFPNSEGFNLPHYPYNPSMIKYGLSWTFYD